MNHMGLFLSYSMDFPDGHNNAINSTGHGLDPCSGWQSVAHIRLLS